MPVRLMLLLFILTPCLAQVGCARVIAGFDRSIEFHADAYSWKDVQYSYLSVNSQPDNAIVSIQLTYAASVNFRVGLFYRDHGSTTIKSEWLTAGSTPVLNHEVSMSGRQTSRKIGAVAHTRYALQYVDVRIEKPGYEPVYLNRVLLNGRPVARSSITVDLVESGGAEVESDLTQ